MWGVRPVSGDIKHKQWIRIASIAKYNKCAGISPGDTENIPSSPPISYISCRQSGRLASALLLNLQGFFPSPSGPHFPVSAFSLRDFWPVLAACMPPSSTVTPSAVAAVAEPKIRLSIRHVTHVCGPFVSLLSVEYKKHV